MSEESTQRLKKYQKNYRDKKIKEKVLSFGEQYINKKPISIDKV